MDNGVLRFDNVRIPRDQMLMRFILLAHISSVSVSLRIPEHFFIITSSFIDRHLCPYANWVDFLFLFSFLHLFFILSAEGYCLNLFSFRYSKSLIVKLLLVFPSVRTFELVSLKVAQIRQFLLFRIKY